MIRFNRLWLTQIYLYQFYIPELILLANDIEVNPGPEISTHSLNVENKIQRTIFYFWDTCGNPVIKCLCFFVVFLFSSATKWKNCAIVPSGHWALNTMTTNCDPMRCSHADHACYLDDDWRCHAQTGPGHMTNHGTYKTYTYLTYKTLLSVVLYFNVFRLRSLGVSRRKRSKYLQTHTQIVLFAANPH